MPFRMDGGEESLRSLLVWWREAGVDSAEASAILEAPRPDRAEAASLKAKPAPVRKIARPPPRSAAEDARAAAGRANSLAELREALEAFDGCALKQTARHLVFSDGIEGADVMVVGETPGREEDAAGKPFLGKSGQLLDRMLGAIGFSRDANLFISNVVFWRPPGNRQATQGEVAACVPFIQRAVELAAPRLLILSGNLAAQTFLQRDDGVMRLRGKRLTCTLPALTEPLHTMVMLHPAYLLSRPQDKRLAWTDLQAFAAWAEEIGVARQSGI